jgi:MYXO-CTERM domain-containing protein
VKKSALLAAPALALAALALPATAAHADGDHAAADSMSFHAELAPVNNSTAAGHAVVDVAGQEATVTVEVAGAPALFQGAPYPHAQHIHIGGQGMCAPPTADADGDGAVSSMEGQPWTGGIGASLTTSGDTTPASAVAIDRFPAGDAYTYQRTVPVDAAMVAALQNGTAVVNVHGADPAALSAAAQAKVNPMAPDLPLASDIPVACGVLASAQMAVPEGPADTGVETAATGSDTNGIIGAAVLGLLALGAAVGVRRRVAGGR